MSEAPKVAGIDGDHLKSFVQRILNLEGEIRDLNADKAEIYEEASSHFDKKALKIVVGRHRKTRAEVDAVDFLVDQYERALGYGERGDPPEVVKVEDLPHVPAYETGKRDGLLDNRDHAADWPDGADGHGDYERGYEDGRAERIDQDIDSGLSRARARSRAREEAPV